MASLFDCLQSAIDNQLVPRQRAQQAQQDFNDLVAKFSTAHPPHIAQAMAAQALKEAAQRSATARRHTVLAQLVLARRNAALVAQARDPSMVPIELIEGKEGTGNTFESVRFTREALRRQFMGMIHEALATHGTNVAGVVRNKVQLKQLVSELHGKASGNAEARRMADAVRAAQTRARVLYNAHGGDIGDLADFGLPHHHEIGKIRAAGFDAWRDEIWNRLAWDRIEDAATGKPFALAPGRGPRNPAAAERMLKDIFDGITTRNWDERAPSMTTGGRSLANSRAEPRTLHFRDADAWMAYNDRFGSTDPFRAMVSHFEGMARDIALMRVLGPNPRGGLEHVVQTAQKALETDFDARRTAAGTDAAKLHRLAALQQRVERRLTRRAAKARAMLDVATGTANVPANEGMANFVAGTQQLLVAAQLGGATVSSITDTWTMRMAAKAVGMNPRNVLSRHVELMASSATRETAAQMGYVADTLANAGSASARYMGEVWAPEITSRISDAVLRLSALNFWTDMARTSFQMEFSGYLATQAGRAFGDIDADLRTTLQSRGITAADWDKLRDPAAMFTAPNGAKFISPLWWNRHTAVPRAEAEGLSLRLGGIIEEQMEFAVPSTNWEGQATFRAGTRPGTLPGLAMSSALMYKSFALSFMLNQFRRAMTRQTIPSRAAYVVTLLVPMILLGGVAVQLKSLLWGRDPRDMTEPAFWGAALMQSGGVGIFGDFLTAETSRAGGGIQETALGPVFGLVSDLARAGASNAFRAAQGKETHLGRDAANLARRYTPGTTLWYARAALDRMLWDQLQWLLDPQATTAWAQQESARQRNTGTGTWYGRGKVVPERLPDFSNMAGR